MKIKREGLIGAGRDFKEYRLIVNNNLLKKKVKSETEK